MKPLPNVPKRLYTRYFATCFLHSLEAQQPSARTSQARDTLAQWLFRSEHISIGPFCNGGRRGKIIQAESTGAVHRSACMEISPCDTNACVSYIRQGPSYTQPPRSGTLHYCPVP